MKETVFAKKTVLIKVRQRLTESDITKLPSTPTCDWPVFVLKLKLDESKLRISPHFN